MFLFVVFCVCFIKFDTPAAAQFTDNVLRPLLGSDRVVALEKIFYNFSDKVDQIRYQNTAGSVPTFDVGESVDSTSLASESNLDLISLVPLSSLKTLKGEGVWHNISLPIFPNKEVMAYSFVRPDSERAFATVTLVQLDMKSLHLSTVAGKREPGGPIGNFGPGVVPDSIIQSGNLVAAFDGGFQFRDGEYGMIVGDKTYLPLKSDLGTLVGYTDGTIKIVNYKEGQDLGSHIEFVRQNCPILIEDGMMAVSDIKNKHLWGRTPTTAIYTWRSGIGITAKGNLLYAVGNNLTPTTLALALKMAGAQNAIQLDINPYWVRFNIFRSSGGSAYSSFTLNKNLTNGAESYLKGYSKDFFYVYKSNP